MQNQSLIERVKNGFLFYATEVQIREQLKQEGVDPFIIDHAIELGKTLADRALGKK